MPWCLNTAGTPETVPGCFPGEMGQSALAWPMNFVRSRRFPCGLYVGIDITPENAYQSLMQDVFCWCSRAVRCQIYVRIHSAVLMRQVHRSRVLFMALGVAHQWCVTPHLTRAELTTLCTTTAIPMYLQSYHKEYFPPSLYFIALVPGPTEPQKHSLTARL